ncbi:family 16 glycoside hydrolase [Sphingomonas sp. MMS24-JH45]
MICSPNLLAQPSQDRGNSGIWFMQRYEIQILDGYDNHVRRRHRGCGLRVEAAARQRGAQARRVHSYDIVFELPRLRRGRQRRATRHITAFLNGALVQNHQAMLGATVWRKVAAYQAHGDAAPDPVAYHELPASFRIWVRPLPEAATVHDLPGGKK